MTAQWTYWLLLDVVEGVAAGVDNLALDLVGPSAVVPQAARAVSDVTCGHSQGLSVVERLDGGEGLGVLVEEVGKFGEHLSTVTRCHVSPATLKRLAGCCDGDVDICSKEYQYMFVSELLEWRDCSY